VTQELGVPIGDNGEWNAMGSNHILEIEIRHMGCIIGLVAWYEVIHFGETVHCYRNGVLVALAMG